MPRQRMLRRVNTSMRNIIETDIIQLSNNMQTLKLIYLKKKNNNYVNVETPIVDNEIYGVHTQSGRLVIRKNLKVCRKLF